MILRRAARCPRRWTGDRMRVAVRLHRRAERQRRLSGARSAEPHVTVLGGRRQWHDGVRWRGDQRILVCRRGQYLIEGRITIQLHVR